MKNSFINEDREVEDEDLPEESSLPKGTRNYMTPGGFKKLKEELHTLLNKTRPELTVVIAWAASNGDRSENADYIYGKRRLREIDRRIHFLSKRLESADVVDPVTVQSEEVLFGATVTIADQDGVEKTYTIVGVDEINFEKNHISWMSPLARALLKNKIGDLVTFKTPKGVKELEIISIKYKAVE